MYGYADSINSPPGTQVPHSAYTILSYEFNTLTVPLSVPPSYPTFCRICRHYSTSSRIHYRNQCLSRCSIVSWYCSSRRKSCRPSVPTIGRANTTRRMGDRYTFRYPLAIGIYSCLSPQTSKFTHLLLTYRQAIFVTVYSHLLRESLCSSR